MNGAQFPDEISVADGHTARDHRLKSEILGRTTNQCAMPDEIFCAHSDIAFNDCVRLHDRSFADDHLRTDDRIGADLHVCAKLRARINDCRGMDLQSTPASLKLK